MSPSTTINRCQRGACARSDRIHTLIRLALLPELACRLDGRFATVLVQVVVRHDLTADELVLKVRAVAMVFEFGLFRRGEGGGLIILDDAGRLGRLRPAPDRPRADLVGPTGEVPNQLQMGSQLVSARCLVTEKGPVFVVVRGSGNLNCPPKFSFC